MSAGMARVSHKLSHHMPEDLNPESSANSMVARRLKSPKPLPSEMIAQVLYFSYAHGLNMKNQNDSSLSVCLFLKKLSVRALHMQTVHSLCKGWSWKLLGNNHWVFSPSRARQRGKEPTALSSPAAPAHGPVRAVVPARAAWNDFVFTLVRQRWACKGWCLPEGCSLSTS